MKVCKTGRAWLLLVVNRLGTLSSPNHLYIPRHTTCNGKRALKMSALVWKHRCVRIGGCAGGAGVRDGNLPPVPNFMIFSFLSSCFFHDHE